MIKNFFLIAWRHIARNKIYTLVNVAGLTLGISACIVIFLVVHHEFSYDTFHPGHKRIYRVMATVTESTGNQLNFARVPVPVSSMGRSGLTGMEVIAGIIPYTTSITVSGGTIPGRQFSSRAQGSYFTTTVFAEPHYFSLFKYTWLAGNEADALAEPFSVVLSESRARQYFGTTSLQDCLGKQVVYADSLTVTITGIIKDWEQPTDLAFTDFISWSTIQHSFLSQHIPTNSWQQQAMAAWVFTKLVPANTSEQVNTQLATLVNRHASNAANIKLWLEPLSELHFDANIIENPIRTAHRPTLYGLTGIALFLLVLAIINYINLSTALSARRAKEIGVRKVLGSGRGAVAGQFLTETFLLTVFAVLLSVALVYPLLHAFRSFIPAGVIFRIDNTATLLFLLSVILLTTVCSGWYPARVLASYIPAQTLKNFGAQPGGGKWLLRRGLIVFQFTVSILFITGSIVIALQLKYTREKNPGFNADAIITLDGPRGEQPGKINVLAENIKKLAAVQNVSLQWLSPMTDNPRGMKLKYKATDTKDFWVTQVAGDEEYIPLYGLQLLAGRNLVKTDTVNELVINEHFSRYMGDSTPAASLGRLLYWNDKPYPVVGVVADFHTSSFHDPVTPLCIINRPDREGAIAVKLATNGKHAGDVQQVIQQIAGAWKKVYPLHTFQYSFYDESLALLYEKDRQTATLVNTATGIAVFISCIGLFGLTLFTASRRAKEISIRKTLGAGVPQIMLLLSREFVWMILLALCLATPVAWYGMQGWLQNFAYHIDLSPWIFLLAGCLALVIALFTISMQTIKAAIANPVKFLRSE